MWQNWHHLLFLHWQVPEEQLRPMVPRQLDIDTFEGRAYVGLVPFTMTGVRPAGFPPLPFLSDFHETNVRTYVHLRGRDPGVWFFSLDAANAVAVQVARALWKLPYHFAKMRLDCNAARADTAPIPVSAANQSDVCINYETERLWPVPLPGNCSVRYAPAGPVMPAVPDTLEHFLVERYILYAGDDRRLFSGRVHHQPYPLQPAAFHSLKESLLAAAGITHAGEPPLAHYAREVNVRIYPLKRVRTDGPGRS